MLNLHSRREHLLFGQRYLWKRVCIRRLAGSIIGPDASALHCTPSAIDLNGPQLFDGLVSFFLNVTR